MVSTTKNIGAGNEIRTRDLDLGKVALYQLSYSRKMEAHYKKISEARKCFFEIF
jgi:hypothetical protein